MVPFSRASSMGKRVLPGTWTGKGKRWVSKWSAKGYHKWRKEVALRRESPTHPDLLFIGSHQALSGFYRVVPGCSHRRPGWDRPFPPSSSSSSSSIAV